MKRRLLEISRVIAQYKKGLYKLLLVILQACLTVAVILLLLHYLIKF